MLRINELRLPLDHAEDALRAAIVARLAIADGDLTAYTVFRRGYDARKKTAIVLSYTIDCEVADEAAVLLQHEGDSQIRTTPDTRYRFVGQVPAGFFDGDRPRPVVVGFGPCGIFAALLLAQMGFKPIVLERGKEVRQRTKDTWGLWRKSVLNPESNVQRVTPRFGFRVCAQVGASRNDGRRNRPALSPAPPPASPYTPHTATGSPP